MLKKSIHLLLIISLLCLPLEAKRGINLEKNSDAYLKIVGKVILYTAVATGTYFLLNNKWFQAKKGIPEWSAITIATFGIGDLFQSKHIKHLSYGMGCGLLATWTVTGEVTDTYFVSKLPNPFTDDPTVRACFYTLAFFGLYSVAFKLLREIKIEYKRLRGHDFDDEQ